MPPAHTGGTACRSQRSVVSHGLWEGAGDGAGFSRPRMGRLLPALRLRDSRRAATDVTHECPSLRERALLVAAAAGKFLQHEQFCSGLILGLKKVVVVEH